MMNASDIALDAMNASMNSQGSAMRENEKYLESLTSKIETLKSSFTNLSVSIGNNGLGQAFGAILETLTFMANGFASLTEATNGWNIKLPLLIGTIYGATKAVGALRVALTGLNMTPIGWIATAVAGFQLLGTAGMGASQALGKSADTFVDAANKASDNANQLEGLIARYEDLQPKAKNSAEAQSELNDILYQIQQIAPQVIETTNEYGDALLLNKDKADQFVQSLRAMNDEQLKNASTKIDIDLTTAKNDLDSAKQNAADIGKDIKAMWDDVSKYNEKYGVETLNEAKAEYLKRVKDLSGEALQDAANEFGQYNLILTKHSKDLDDYSDQLTKVQEAEAKVNELEDKKKQIEGLTTSQRELNKAIKESFNNNIDSKVYGDFNDKQLSALVEFGDKVKENKGNIEEYASILEKAKIPQEKIDEIIKASTTTFTDYSGSVEETGEAVEDLATRLKNAQGDLEALAQIAKEMVQQGDISGATDIMMGDAYEAASEKIAIYNGLLEDMAEGKQLSAAEAMDLISKSHELRDVISNENGIIKVNIDVLAQMRDMSIKAYQDKIKIIKEEVLTHHQALLQKLGMFKEEVMAIQTVADAEAKADEVRKKKNEAFKSGAYQFGIAAANQEAALADLGGELKKLDELGNLTAQSHKEVGTSFADTSKETEKAKDELKEYNFIADEHKSIMEDINLLMEKNNAEKSKYSTYSRGYQNALKQEIKLLQQQKDAIDAQTKSLQQQIVSGNIVETGVVETSNNVTSVNGVGVDSATDFINKSVKAITAITAEQLNKIIDQKAPKNSLFRGQGQAIIDASKASGLDPLYLLAHAAHETGWGTSNIAKKKNNFFGIGAFDASPYKSAYGFNGVTAGFVEGAKWIAKNYANGKYGQDTLYKMRNNNGTHQYATDPKWDDKIANIMEGIVSSLGGIAPAVVEATASVTQTVTKELSGWDVPLTSGYGTRTHPVTGEKGKMHHGVDLAFKQGSNLESNISGEVIWAKAGSSPKGTGYSGYGGVVAVKDAQGNVHVYAHMSEIGVERGQFIEAGTSLGKTGGAKGTYGAGTSTGAHLHYEVRKNGEYGNTIDPMAYVKQAQSGQVSSTVSSSDNYSKDLAEAQQREADAKSQVKSLQGESAATQTAIENAVSELISSIAERFAKKEENYDVAIQNSIARTQNDNLQEGTDGYNKELQGQINSMVQRRKQNRQEINYLLSLQEAGVLEGVKLTEAQLNNIKDLLTQARTQNDEYVAEQKDAEGRLVESFLTNYENKKSQYDQAIANSNIRLSRTYEGSNEYYKELEGQTVSLAAKKKENEDEIAYLEEVLKTHKLNDQFAKEFTERLQELRNVQHEIEQETTNIAKSIIDSRLTGYESKKSNYDKALENSEVRLGRLTKGSEAYRAELEKQKASLAGKQKENADEIAYLENAIKTYELTPEAMQELINQLHELKIAQNELIDGSLQKNAEIMDDMLDELTNKVDQINYKIQRTQEIMSRSEEGSPEWLQGNDDLRKLYQEQADITLSDRTKLLEKLKSTSLTPEKRNEYRKELNRLSLEYQGYLSDIHNLDEAELNWKEQLADKTIEVMKRAIEKERDFELAAIDKEMEALDKKHEKKMKQYDEELDRINEVYNDAIEAIDKQESEDTYQKELSDLQGQRADVQGNIDKIALDNSIEAEARRAELKKQREELDKQIEELKHNREVELRKESLQEELEKNQKEVEDKKEAEKDKFDASKERLEDEKKELEYYYNEILANEREWNDLRTQIINEETDEVEARLQGFLDNFKGKNEEVTKDLQSSWQELKNLLDEIKESQEEIEEYDKNMEDRDDDESSSPTPTVKQARITGTGFTDQAQAVNVRNKMADDYGGENAKVVWDGSFYRVMAEFESEERAEKVLAKLKERKLLTNGSIQTFSTGGYTGDSEGLAYLHDKEIVLNKDDTKNMLDAVKIIRNLTNFNISDFLPSVETLKSMINIPSFGSPSFTQQPSLAGGGSGDIYLNFNVDKMYGTEKEAKQFSTKIIDTLKNKGKII